MIYGSFESIADAWKYVVRNIVKTGVMVNTEYGESARMVNGMLIEIRNPKEGWHPRDPFCSPTRIGVYKEQFKRGYKHGFEYTYMDRLTQYPINSGTDPRAEAVQQAFYGSAYFDQLAWMRAQLESRRDTKRIQAITWVPTRDTETESPPCLQRLWCYPYANGECDVHINYRSWDIYKGFEANLNGLLCMVNEELIFPNDLTVKSLRCFGDNVHIYDSDLEDAGQL
jgi:thymidylate synthase